jgi:hypothetical protein
LAQKLTTICDFCLTEGVEIPNLGKYQAEVTIRDTTLVADMCDKHMGAIAVGFHPRRGRSPSWLQELRGEEPAAAPKQRKRRQAVEAETPPAEPEVEPDEDDADTDEEENDEETVEAVAV